MSAEDEARAAAYRESLDAREQWQRALVEAMTGDDTKADTVRSRWEPFRSGDRRLSRLAKGGA